jgi:hypothetical protein
MIDQWKKPHFWIMLAGLVMLGCMEQGLLTGTPMKLALVLVGVMKLVGIQLAYAAPSPKADPGKLQGPDVLS